MRNLVIILDPAHGSDVAGKRSPDNTHLEYEWSRMICSDLYKDLTGLGFQVYITNPEEREIGLTKRKNIANSINASSNQIKLLLSLHNNACTADGSWGVARGYEVYTSRGQTLSDKIADILMKNLIDEFPSIDGYKARYDNLDGDLDREANFTVLMGSNYYAVLIEWLFMDNLYDLSLLKSDDVNYRFIQTIIRSLLYIDKNLNEIRNEN